MRNTAMEGMASSRENRDESVIPSVKSSSFLTGFMEDSKAMLEIEAERNEREKAEQLLRQQELEIRRMEEEINRIFAENSIRLTEALVEMLRNQKSS